MSARRSRLHAYLLLARVSNLPTVWTNVLAGTVVSGAAVSRPAVAKMALAVSLLYTAGMFLNDAFDRAFDARFRPDRPIPAGDVTSSEAFIGGWALLAGGVAVLAVVAPPAAVVWTLLLVGAIVYYDYRHKRDTLGPVVMGICRGLVYCVAAAAAAAVATPVIVAAVVLTAYVVSLTWIAKRVGQRAGWLIPLLVAGIALVDAAVIALGGAPALAPWALLGFVATLLLQRVVPGT
jgi:4-hydroxybenzoate polyprenyltransferase